MDDLQRHIVTEVLKGRSYGEILAEMLPYLEPYEVRFPPGHSDGVDCPHCRFHTRILLN